MWLDREPNLWTDEKVDKCDFEYEARIMKRAAREAFKKWKPANAIIPPEEPIINPNNVPYHIWQDKNINEMSNQDIESEIISDSELMNFILQDLTPIEKKIILLHNVEVTIKRGRKGMIGKKIDFRQIAKMLNMPKSTVSDYHNYAKEKIKKKFKEFKLDNRYDRPNIYEFLVTNIKAHSECNTKLEPVYLFEMRKGNKHCTRIKRLHAAFNDLYTVCPGNYCSKFGEITCSRTGDKSLDKQLTYFSYTDKVKGKQIVINKYYYNEILAIYPNGPDKHKGCEQQVFDKRSVKIDERRQLELKYLNARDKWLDAKPNGKNYRDYYLEMEKYKKIIDNGS